MPNRSPLSALILAASLAAGGCGINDPYSSHPQRATASTATASTPAPLPQQNPGETPAPPAPSPSSQTPASVAGTPQQAIRRFAGLYINWSWQTLQAQQRQLAQLSVGAARLAEQQAAAAAGRDSEITRAKLYNRGQIISIAPSQATPSQWVIVTREQTAGNSQYTGLQTAYHITLAELAPVPGGYAISKWLPQN